MKSFSGLLCLALGVAACLNPNSYSTPRTTPVGHVQHVVAVEYVSYRTVTPGPTPKLTQTGNSPVAPTYAFRVGLTDKLDIGGRIGNGSSLGADLKWNFLKTDSFDMAVAPGLQTFYVWDGAGGQGGYAHFFGNAPLLLGINASPSFSIVPSLGLGYGFGRAADVYNNEQEEVASTQALLLQAGIGLDFRVSPTFAIHPEMSLLRGLTGPATPEMTWYTFGLGFNWGVLPRYGATSP